MPLSDITPKTWTDSVADLTDANFNTEVRDSYNLQLNPPSASVVNTASQSIPITTWTQVTINSLIYDTMATSGTPQWASGTPNKLTCRLAGWYEVTGSCEFNNPTGFGVILSAIQKTAVTSGTTLYGGSSVSTNNVTFGVLDICVSVLMQLAAGDDIYFMLYQSTGAAITTLPNGFTPIFTMTRRRGI